MLPWQWRSRPLENRTGSEIFDLLFRKEDSIATLLESPALGSSSLAQYSICAGSPRPNRSWTPEIGNILPFLNNLLSQSFPQEIPSEIAHLPFTGGWLGWLGYDLAWEIERLPHLNRDPLPFPIAFWYEPDSFAVLDHQQQTLWLAATHTQDLDILEQRLNCPVSPQTPAGELSGFSFLTSQSEYEDAVRQAKKYIQAGDIFQANLSLRFEVQTTASSWSIYQALQKVNPSPFASYWQTPWGSVISCSPERLIQLQGKKAQTRPIAGTRSRGKTPEQDKALAVELLQSAKDQSEHIMLLDLERNDLGRVCDWGSVEVDELLTIEYYSHVMHLVSNVTGTLNADHSPIDLVRAMFPGGTITGCPKVRCLEIIEELEPVRRSLFYGSCGYLDHRGNLDLNILIRTLLFQSASTSSLATVWGQVGAGIVADSDPEKEWYESLNKAEAQVAALKMATRLGLNYKNDTFS